MARAPKSLQPLSVSRESAGDRIEERRGPTGRLRWTSVLTGFMRLLALLWIMKGLSAWAMILGVWTPGTFEARATGYQVTTIYFSVIDLVAAVGLWMASTWGGVLWLLAVMSHLILAAFFPGVVSSTTAILGFFLSLIAAYLVVSWLSAREE